VTERFQSGLHCGESLLGVRPSNSHQFVLGPSLSVLASYLLMALTWSDHEDFAFGAVAAAETSLLSRSVPEPFRHEIDEAARS
jgi:hypothetical protein